MTKRLQKGEPYFFISIPYWKVCQTRDEHFGTDDEKFAEGNYFTDAKLVHECFDTIDDKYSGPLEKLRAQQAKAKDVYMKAVKDTIAEWKAKKADSDEAMKAISDAYEENLERNREINSERRIISAEIMKIIKNETK